MSLPSSNPQPDRPEARQYNRSKRWVGMADQVMGIGFLVLLLATGWNRGLRDLSMKTGGDHYWLQLFFYVLLLSAISKILGIGLDFYSFRLEHRFNLSNQKLGSWVKDQIKGWILGLIMVAVMAEIVYALIRTSPEHWWIFAWLVFTTLFILLVQIAPEVLFPLFYKFVPLQNEELKSRLMKLGERSGTRIRGVYEWKLSEKSKKGNAALAGLGSTRRIIIADTLLQNCNDDEIEALMAHELGHKVHSHILKSILIEALVTLASFWAANSVLQYATRELQQTTKFQHLADFANLPLLGLVYGVLSILLMPAHNAYSRLTERQADLYCWKSVPSITPFITAMEKLTAQNLSERSPSRLVEIIFHSHPPTSKRIAAAEAWANTNRPSLAT